MSIRTHENEVCRQRDALVYDLMCPETRVLHTPDSFFLGISQVRNHRVSAHTKVRRSPSANRAVRRQATFGRMPPTQARVNRTPPHSTLTCGDSTPISFSRVKHCVNSHKSDRVYARSQRDDGRSKEMAPSFLILRRRLPALLYLCSALRSAGGRVDGLVN